MLEVKDLTARYGRAQILNGMSLIWPGRKLWRFWVATARARRRR